MSRPYKVIRNLMQLHGLANEDVAEHLDCAVCTVSHKLNAHYAWTCDEMWKLMDLFKQPPSKLHELFPAHGKA